MKYTVKRKIITFFWHLSVFVKKQQDKKIKFLVVTIAMVTLLRQNSANIPILY